MPHRVPRPAAVASAQPCSIPRLNWARGYTLSCVLFGYAYTVEGDSGPALAGVARLWLTSPTPSHPAG